jgi:CRISPR-associated protein Csm5
MTEPFTSHNAWVTTLSPLHLGSGEDYLPTHYVITDGYLHAFGDQQLARGLGASGIGKLAEIVNRSDDSALREVQKLVHQSADKLVPLASHSVWVAPGINALYQQRIGEISQREQGRNIQNQLHIQRTFSNPYDHLPVLTGSAIKGAIRTAWLDALNQGQALRQSDRGKERSSELQQRLLGTSKRVEEDPFYLLKISDGSYRHPDGVMPAELWFAVSRKRKPVEGRNPANLYAMLECIGAWRGRAFAVDIRFLDGSLRKTSQKVPHSLPDLAAASNRYYLPKLERELSQLGDDAGFLSDDWSKAIRNLLDGEMGAAIRTNRAMLLRLGKHSGSEDKTLDGVRNIKIKGKNGAKDTFRSETTEVRLAASSQNDQKNLLPFGWVLVEFEQFPLDGTQALIKDAAAPAYRRLVEENAWRDHRAEALAEEARQQAEHQVRQAEQAAAQEEERRKAKELAKQPLEIQVLTAFHERIAADAASKNQGLGSTLGQELRAFIESAGNWPSEHRQQAREVVAKAFAHLNVDRKKNPKAKDLWRLLGDVQ